MFKVLLLNISKTYSDSDCSETNLRVSPFKEDHAYNPNGPRTACNLLWVCFLGGLGTFYRNRKGLIFLKRKGATVYKVLEERESIVSVTSSSYSALLDMLRN